MEISAKVIVDADACPRACLRILQEEQAKRGFSLVTVASFNHVIDNSQHITVGNEKEAADMVVINNTKRGDLVITQDWGLASLVLGKGAWALSPSGKIYSNKQIDLLLEERALKARFRRAGGRTKGPSKRTAQTDTAFKQNLSKLLDSMKD